MISMGCLIAGLCIGLVLGKLYGMREEAQSWRWCARNPQNPPTKVYGDTAFIIMRTADFYEHWYNPLVSALRKVHEHG